ncbi:MAG: thioredoxin fold domain-containing protein [Idiomarina sp.]|nr:thioredoxin fold domain-containing protein [Idiomarina sp.]
MFRLVKCVAAVAFLVTSVGANLALADEQVSEESIVEQLSQMGLVVENMRPAAELPGYFQVFTQQGIFYITKDGTRMITGRVYSTGRTAADLTEENLKGIRLDLIAESKGMMIDFPAPTERYRITVFTDHTCPFCRTFHEQLDEYHARGISVQYLAYPRSGLDHDSAVQLNNIWCARDTRAAITNAKNGRTPVEASCDADMADHLRLGRQMGVTGTPAIILPNGSLIPGYAPPERLIMELRNSRS